MADVKGMEDLENLMSEEETKQHHTTQFVWVVTLKDNNPSSPSYNRFMWVVMPILDSRYEFAPGAMTQDTALPDGEFLYCFPSEKLLNKSTSIFSLFSCFTSLFISLHNKIKILFE